MAIYRSNETDGSRPSRWISTFGDSAMAGVVADLGRCPRYRPSPLQTLPELARTLGIGQLWIKDERARLGSTSFKALGGARAVFASAAASLAASGASPSLEAMIETRAARDLTFTTATAGNHGRSVATGARLIGARCVIFVYDGVPPDQVEAIAREGAEIVHVAGDYDDAVDACRARADAGRWHLVSDSSWPGYVEAPLQIMQGYAIIADELRSQLTSMPSHVFVQAGVGGLAAALAARFSVIAGSDQPRAIIVEPEGAACLLASATAGRPTEIVGREPSTMGRLDCYRPSIIADEVLRVLAHGYVAISDRDADRARRLLHAAGFDSSPSGAAGLAGLIATLEEHRERADIAADSDVLVVLTESATLADRTQGRP